MRLLFAIAVLFVGCGPRPCSAETTDCACYARRDECQLITDSCWCPSACDPSIRCVCGGGMFLRCEAR